MKRILPFIVGLFFAASAVAQPVTTKPNVSNIIAQCLTSVPIVGAGAGVPPICHASGALGALSFVTPGTGIAAALALNTGSAGAPVLFNGALGTPSSGTLTSATGLPVATGISGLGTGIATALAVNTGSAGAPVLFNGALGTPTSGTATNITGLPTTGLTGTLQAAQEPAHTGQATNSAGSLAMTVNAVTGTATNDNAGAGIVGEYKNGGTLLGSMATATVTITNASPAVITWTAHGFLDNAPVYFTTTGTLPTGFSPSTNYYVVAGSQATNTFQLSATIGGAAINTSSAGSGVHTGNNAIVANNSGINQNITALSLTAGDWDVSAMGFATGGATTNVAYVLFSLSTTSAVLDTSNGRETVYPQISTPFAGGGVIGLPISSARFSLSGTTTVYMVINTIFSVSTMSAYGSLHARRMR